MAELIAGIIFIISFGGVVFILTRNASALNDLPKNGSSGIKKYRAIAYIEEKFSKISIAFEKQIFLHKLLSWVKVITLRFETKVDQLLHSIRKRAKK